MPNLELGTGPDTAPPGGSLTPQYMYWETCPVASPTIGIAGWTQAAAAPNWASITILAGNEGWYYYHAILPIEATSGTPVLSFDLYVDGASVLPLPLTYGIGRHTFQTGDFKLINLVTLPFPMAAGVRTLDVYWQNTGTGGATMLNTVNESPLLLLISAGTIEPVY